MNARFIWKGPGLGQICGLREEKMSKDGFNASDGDRSMIKSERRLAAIMSADVEGFSRLMSDDELTTVLTLKHYREIMARFIQQYGGRIVDSPGDNCLAEFSSVVYAIQAAVEIQKSLKKHNSDLPKNRHMAFRIGVNMGDIIAEGGRIYGDSVNVTARLEMLADPGGICISRCAYDQVKDKLALGYAYLGRKRVKNIQKPLQAYRVLPESKKNVNAPEEESHPFKWKSGKPFSRRHDETFTGLIHQTREWYQRRLLACAHMSSGSSLS